MIESKFKDALKIVSVSGGKDSTALYLWSIERFGKNGFQAVFADTGHEHPVTYNYVRNLPLITGGPSITWVKADFKDRILAKGKTPSGNPFLDLMLWKGRAPSSKAQFCTEHLKLRPIKEWLEKIRGDNEVVMLTGIRAGESTRRSKMPRIEWSNFFDCETYRPLLLWSETEIFNYLKFNGLNPNPLYDAGFKRVGCFPCIHARKKELAMLPEDVWQKLENWEKQIGRSWFPAGLVPEKFIPTIDDVRFWSKTKHGGKQIDENAPDAADVPSCMSTWGICE